MNIKGIIGTVLMFMVITSCSKESFIGELPNETGAFTLSFTMSEDVETKAAVTEEADQVNDNADGYKYSTEKELNINNCYIAIFAKGPDDGDDAWTQKVLIQKYTEYSGLNISKVGSFSVAGISLPIKTRLKVLVIANFPEDDEDIPDSYIAWKEKTVSYNSEVNDSYYTFNPETLIKVGEDEIMFNSQSDKKTIKLKQLSAKISLNLDLANGSFNTFKLSEVRIKNVGNESKLFIPSSSATTAEYFHKLVAESGVGKIDGICFYTYARSKVGSDDLALTVQLTGVWGKGSAFNTTSNQFDLYLNKSSAIEAGNYYEVKGTLQQNISSFKIYIQQWNTAEVGVSYN